MTENTINHTASKLISKMTPYSLDLSRYADLNGRKIIVFLPENTKYTREMIPDPKVKGGTQQDLLESSSLPISHLGRVFIAIDAKLQSVIEKIDKTVPVIVTNLQMYQLSVSKLENPLCKNDFLEKESQGKNVRILHRDNDSIIREIEGIPYHFSTTIEKTIVLGDVILKIATGKYSQDADLEQVFRMISAVRN